MSLSNQEVLEQSKAAFAQWGEMWKKNARINGVKYKKDGNSHKNYMFSGIGKKLICVAFAPSFEYNIDLLKKTDMDIACVDKCLSRLLDNGIIPKYVFLADAGIDYKKWLEPYLDKTKDITLIANITCNPEWVNNWKGDVLFYVNKDNIETEKIYIAESGCRDIIPASSNVGNTVVVFSTQIFGYDEYLLLGYDYCWGDRDKYYAFEDSDKRWWMKHAQVIDKNGELVNTSGNLLFSARWLSDFYTNVAIKQPYKIYNCSDKGILSMPQCNLKKKIADYNVRKISNQEKSMVANKRMETINITSDTSRDELLNLLNTLPVMNVQINYLPKEVESWLRSDI